MGREELFDKIKEQVILREGDIRDHEWEGFGLLAEAKTHGLSKDNFLARVRIISNKFEADFGRYNSLKNKIIDAYERSEGGLSQAEISTYAQEAKRLDFAKKFVGEIWIPHLVKDIPPPVPKPAPIEVVKTNPQSPSKPTQPPDDLGAKPMPGKSLEGGLSDQDTNKRPPFRGGMLGILFGVVATVCIGWWLWPWRNAPPRGNSYSGNTTNSSRYNNSAYIRSNS